MAYKPKEIIARAKKFKKNGMVYGYGYKNETITAANIAARAKMYAYTSSQIALMKKKIGKKGIDCSGFVNLAAGTNLGGSAQIYATSPQKWKISDPSHVRTGMFVWRSGHIGLVYIEFGKKYIIEAASTAKDIIITPWEERASAFTHYGKIKGVSYASDKKKSYKNYSEADFVKEMRKALGLSSSASRVKILEATVTVSVEKNRYAACVSPLEKRLTALGYYTGIIEEDEGRSPIFGDKLGKAVKKYKKKWVNVSHPEKATEEVKARGTMWKLLLGL